MIKTTEEFIQKAKLVHGDSYDYNISVFCNLDLKIEIFCKSCGVYFWQKTKSHLNGHGHKDCNNKQVLKTLSQFIEESKSIHGDIFNYNHTIYSHSHIKLKLECKICGNIFSVTPDQHLNKKTKCKSCTNNRLSRLYTLTLEEFINKAKEIHGDIYDYSLVEYIKSTRQVNIICKVHGVFPQTPMSHLQQCGCPKCTSQISNGQEEVFNFIQSIYPNTILEDRITYPGLQLDITIPDKNLAIEYNGVYWHAINFDHSRSPSHLKDKLLKAQELGLRVINIYEDEWQNSRSHIEQIIKNALGVIETKIMARKCKIWSIDTSDPRWNTHVKPFFEKFHHQGLKYKPEGVAYCLTYDNIIQAIAYFGSNSYHNQNDCELIRYATRADVKVVGGLSKLVTNFLRQNPEVKKIKSYCDARLFTGDGYRKAGFKFIEHSSPGFDVISGSWNNLIRKHRSCIIKNKLSSYFDEETLKSKTQMELAADLGWYVVPDCGQIVFEYF